MLPLRARIAGTKDDGACARWLGQGHHGPWVCGQNDPEVLGRLIAEERIRALLIEEHDIKSAAWRLVGCGISAFVVPSALDHHLADPRPFLLGGLLFQERAGANQFLGPAQIGRANAGDGLHLVVEYAQLNWDFADPHWRVVAAIAHTEYRRHHTGYRLQRVLQEGWTAHEGMYLGAGYRAHSRLDIAPDVAGARADLSGGGCGARTLFYADKDESFTRAPGLPVTSAFDFIEPKCGLAPGEQRVLAAAVGGMTDGQIAELLKISLNAVKQSWRSIYARIADTAPFVIPPEDEDSSDGKRGPEKRRRVIAFIEEHPQEIRPYLRSVLVAMSTLLEPYCRLYEILL